jgi:hypothetical protein
MCTKFKKSQAKMCQQSKPTGINNSMIATINTTHSLITDPPGLIQFDKYGNAFKVTQNFSPCTIWIERNNSMELAQNHTYTHVWMRSIGLVIPEQNHYINSGHFFNKAKDFIFRYKFVIKYSSQHRVPRINFL